MWIAGTDVSSICRKVGRSREWFYKWLHRYQDQGPNGLRDRPRTPSTSPRQLSPEIREAIVRTRARLVNGRGPLARYRLAGAPTIRHELECLGYDPLPALRTIERVLQEAGQTNPPLRFQPTVASADYPGPRATASNHVHQCDLVGPRYLKGSRRRYYFLVYKDVYDQTPYIEFHRAPTLDVVLDFVVRAWQRLGLPRQLQIDNGAFFAGSGRWPGSLGRFIRLALLVGIELIFIPPGEPFRNGSVENFNGWFQERLFSIRLHRPVQVRRELQALMDVCSQEHVHPHLGYRTAQEVRRSLSPRRLPASFERHRKPMPIATGKITFIRKVRPSGRITILGVKVHVDKRKRGRYVRATLYTRTATLKIYHARKLLKEVVYPMYVTG